MDQYEALKTYFGYDSFREGQETLVRAILAGRDVVGIMPTGAGKSICFQIPALLLPGVTLVVSPLVSLMKDQVTGLCQAGVSAAYLNSTLSPGQYRKALANLGAGVYKLVYIAPERLLNEEFLAVLEPLEISLVAVDEAHCISQWGQDFRPSYLEVPTFIERLPKRPVLAAFTATATARVKQDIVARLHLAQYEYLLTGFDRANLYFEVRRPENKDAALLALLKARKRQTGIVYCSTRKAVEQVTELLVQNGHRARRYHAGLESAERQGSQEAFLYDECDIIVATNAFGMGIDKSDVRFVIHYNMPLDLESYYQEAGRAGRDGLPADCILLYHGRDVITNRFLLERGNENAEIEDDKQRAELLRIGQERLRQMTFYSTTKRCLRHEILRYFGEESPAVCGHCSSCCRDLKTVDITLDAQKILSAVKRGKESIGSKTLIEMLRGKESRAVRELRLDTLTTFGILASSSEKELEETLRILIAGDLVRIDTAGKEPVLKLGSEGAAVLFRGEKVYMKRSLPGGRDAIDASGDTVPTQAGHRAKTPERRPLSAEETELFELLRAYRLAAAKRQGLPAFAVMTDATLHDLCCKKPQSAPELLTVSGLGAQKVKVYGAELLELLAQHSRHTP